MPGRHDDVMRRVHDAAFDERGTLDRDTRLAAATGRGIPAALAPYADKVAWHAYRISDGDVDRLRADGYSDDAIFELTVAVALGAGLLRRDVGLAALEAAR